MLEEDAFLRRPLYDQVGRYKAFEEKRKKENDLPLFGALSVGRWPQELFYKQN